MFRTVFPSRIRSLRLYIQHQVYVKQILLTACWRERDGTEFHLVPASKQSTKSVWRIPDTVWTVLRWVHTCNVTAYRNAVTLQVTDTIRSYKLNFHPVPYGVTVSYERYTLGFPVCYGRTSDVFATSSGFVHLYILSFKEKEKRGAVVTCHVARPHLLRP